MQKEVMGRGPLPMKANFEGERERHEEATASSSRRVRST